MSSAWQQRLQETERQLAELQQQKDAEDSVLTLSDEQQAALENFQRQKVEIRKELRAVQHELDKDIEALGSQLKVLNIFILPLLLTLVQLGCWLCCCVAVSSCKRLLLIMWWGCFIGRIFDAGLIAPHLFQFLMHHLHRPFGQCELLTQLGQFTVQVVDGVFQKSQPALQFVDAFLLLWRSIFIVRHFLTPGSIVLIFLMNWAFIADLLYYQAVGFLP